MSPPSDARSSPTLRSGTLLPSSANEMAVHPVIAVKVWLDVASTDPPERAVNVTVRVWPFGYVAKSTCID
jgi:hypothetical protein